MLAVQQLSAKCETCQSLFIVKTVAQEADATMLSRGSLGRSRGSLVVLTDEVFNQLYSLLHTMFYTC